MKIKPKYDTSFSTRRIEALTDGVFAIAMTLLVLDLKVADLARINTSSELWNYLIDNQAGLISFVISFTVLGAMWAVHMRQFEYITKADRHFTMINTLRLLIVVLIPLTTSIAGDYQELVLGRALLPINFFLLALVSYWQWSYATKPKNKFYDKLTPEIIQYSNARNVAILIISPLIILASLRVGDIAFLLLLLTTPVIRLLPEPKKSPKYS